VLRLSYAAVCCPLLLVVQDATGSFAVAGAAVGAHALPSLLAPYKSRLVDGARARPTLTCLRIGYAAVLTGIGASAVGGVDAAPDRAKILAGRGRRRRPDGEPDGLRTRRRPGDALAVASGGSRTERNP
jgi:hypothetical protein